MAEGGAGNKGCQGGQQAEATVGKEGRRQGKRQALVREPTWPLVIVWDLGPAKTRMDCDLGLCDASHMGTAQPGQCSETDTTHS